MNAPFPNLPIGGAPPGKRARAVVDADRNHPTPDCHWIRVCDRSPLADLLHAPPFTEGTGRVKRPEGVLLLIN